MDECGKHNVIPHDFKEVFERVSMLNLTLKKSNLSAEFQGRQLNDVVNYKLYF